jgi:hypothetical protein
MIEGQVAAIINSRELAINRGSSDGVEVGMKFEVLEKGGMNITDPETNARLGSVSIVKIRVQAVRVDRKFSVASTYETIGRGINFAALMGAEAARVRTLKLDEAMVDPLTEPESYVKRGDPVRQIVERNASGQAGAQIAKPSRKIASRPEPSK